MRVACIQMCSGDDPESNLDQAAVLLGQAADEQARLAVLPENFSFMSMDDADKHRVVETLENSRVMAFLADQARRLGVYIVGGTVALKSDTPPGLYNACPVFGADGACLAIYHKMHLFEVTLPTEYYRESDTAVPGERPVIASVGDWRVGLSICYDLRFPELYRHYSAHGAHILTVPSAFTVPTGRAHWQTLLRARAIENQCFVLAAAQYGRHPGGRRTWGHSMVLDPWGDVLAEVPEGNGVAVADLHTSRLEEVRAILPALQHRRMNS
ncbi:MAG TPA: carbon-nitrogen hydrolase family protein [Mariprofundaceae bacterium]|nr:carbon-nitrogen hydrolase family protein [Mariprofundaceae bacterium]